MTLTQFVARPRGNFEQAVSSVRIVAGLLNKIGAKRARRTGESDEHGPLPAEKREFGNRGRTAIDTRGARRENYRQAVQVDREYWLKRDT